MLAIDCLLLGSKYYLKPTNVLAYVNGLIKNWNVVSSVNKGRSWDEVFPSLIGAWGHLCTLTLHLVADCSCLALEL